LKGVNLQSVLGGFGWAANAPENSTRSISFYLDDIAFDLPRLSEPHFLVSFETQPTGDAVDRVLKNTAYTYDNALALMAFLAVGDQARARIIADAFVEAQQNDRYFQDGSLRNAYQGGDLMTPPGWLVNGKSRSVRLPGFTSDSKDQQCEWAEDTYNVSRDTGNIAWAMLGLLAYHEAVATPGEHTQYLESVEKLGDWVAANCADTTGTGGYTGGFNGWEGRETKKTYKATEHNIDLYAAFQRLYLLTGNELWKQRADMAKTFVLRMWDEQDGKFWAGTMDDGITINKSVVPLDIQAWALLALRGDGKPYLRSLDYAEKEMRKGGGYDFSEKPVDLPPSLKGRDVDGVWYEGTAHMAVAYKLIDKLVGDSNPAFQRKADELVMFLKSNQTSDGGIMACDKELWTGFYLSDGSPWLYYPRKHIGATAWLIFVETGVNPFWMEAKL
jgi:hypothetical protein